MKPPTIEKLIVEAWQGIIILLLFVAFVGLVEVIK